MAEVNFDASEYEPSDGNFEVMPAGWVRAHVTASEVKSTKKGDGKYLNLRCELTGNGKNDGRVVFDNLNLWNPNAEAVSIAQKQFSALCRAVGCMQVHDSEELHFKPFEMRLAVKPARGIYEASNVIKGYRAVKREAATAATSQGDGGATPGSEKPAAPWEK